MQFFEYIKKESWQVIYIDLILVMEKNHIRSDGAYTCECGKIIFIFDFLFQDNFL